MSSSPNSEKTPSWQPKREVKIFEKFGMTFKMGVVTETRRRWTRVVKNKAGDVIDASDAEAMKALIEAGGKPYVDWVQTDEDQSNSYVEWVRFSDNEMCKDNYVSLFSTADGPILGIVMEKTDKSVFLLDPCVIQFDAKSGSISYMPIFNADRTLDLAWSAVRTQQPPIEIIVASYPGFILQNRMYEYQLKPKVPFEVTPELDNDADTPVTTSTE